MKQSSGRDWRKTAPLIEQIFEGASTEPPPPPPLQWKKGKKQFFPPFWIDFVKTNLQKLEFSYNRSIEKQFKIQTTGKKDIGRSEMSSSASMGS